MRQTRRAFVLSALALSGGLVVRRLFSRPASSGVTPSVQTRRLRELDAPALEPDVCILGSGPAGAVLAGVLVGRGIKTLLVESGPDGASRPTATWVGELDAYGSSGELIYPVATTRFRGAGGTTNLWTGNCPRLHPLDFEPNAYTPAGAPWPIRYHDLEPYYVRAEEELSVRGMPAPPFAPPRNAPFPRPLTVETPNLRRLLQRSQMEIALQQLPLSDWHGRPLNIAESHLPSFSASPHGTLVCGATATRILCDADGQITGVELQAIGESQRTVRARVYVLACGGIETARLLLLSRSPRFPDGLGNHSDLVGRCFMDHPAVVIGRGTVRGLWNPLSPVEKGYSEQFVAEAKYQGFGGIRFRLVAHRDPLDFNWRSPLQIVWDGARVVQQINIEVKAQIEMEPSPANRLTLIESHRDAFGNPGVILTLRFTEKDRQTIRYSEKIVRQVLTQLGAENVDVAVGVRYWDHHHMGTCRMGDDPRTSVVDRNLKVHGVDNLYVAGSAPFVTGSVSNPTLTIVALSLRMADHLTNMLRP